MAATFTVETGTGATDSNSYCSVADADQYHENHSGSTVWSAASQANKEKALRLATQYLDLHYNWKFYRVTDEQALEWPKSYVQDRNGFAIGSDVIPQQIKDATAHLALESLNGDTLLPDLADEAAIKRLKVVAGPLTKETEYVGGETPTKKYTVVDKLVQDFVKGGQGGLTSADLIRA